MSQEIDILNYLKSGKSLTPLEAFQRFNCMRLGARIWDLRHQGHNIQSKLVTNGKKHFEEYWLSDEPQDTPLEEAIRHSNQVQEEKITRKAFETDKGQYAFLV